MGSQHFFVSLKVSASDSSKGLPPILPPHLLNIVLNQDVEKKCDPVNLPEIQSHVMLNHLYAQSIRDQTLVLATTLRYKKKCVTTVFYTPL